VPAELREPAFDLKVTVLRDSINGFRLRICLSSKIKQHTCEDHRGSINGTIDSTS
jgi:hypothetical protein